MAIRATRLIALIKVRSPSNRRKNSTPAPANQSPLCYALMVNPFTVQTITIATVTVGSSAMSLITIKIAQRTLLFTSKSYEHFPFLYLIMLRAIAFSPLIARTSLHQRHTNAADLF